MIRARNACYVWNGEANDEEMTKFLKKLLKSKQMTIVDLLHRCKNTRVKCLGLEYGLDRDVDDLVEDKEQSLLRNYFRKSTYYIVSLLNP